MGLDMYLKENNYISTYLGREKVFKFEVIVKSYDKNGEVLKTTEQVCVEPASGLELNIPVGYWRKANAIHKWFVDNCGDGIDNCQKMYVNYEKLSELKKICEDVLADRNKASELLPTTEGFFFGSTEYDEDYFNDVRDTIDIINKCSDGKSYEYEASW